MQGKQISGYTLQRRLGIGGMAEVWYAENKIGKKAAVKLLLPKLCQDEVVVSRFLTEAKVMVDLNHPNIRQVYDYSDIDGRPAIVMEYLEGEDLKARMKRGQRFTDEELKRWWNQLVDALNYTHKKGIVHRDIKPGNIFADNEGNIKLLDFGIAKVRESISSTQTGQKLGTLMYMSPEQVKDSKRIDYRTDIYSLAVTFVHLISGKKPYDSDTSSDFEISEQIVYKPLDLSGVPLEWQPFLTPYLSKNPEQRPTLRPFGVIVLPRMVNDDETEMDVRFGTSAPRQNSPIVTKAPSKPKKKNESKRVPIVLAIVVILLGVAGLVAWLIVIPKGPKADVKLFADCQKKQDVNLYRFYVEQFPNGDSVAVAKAWIKNWEQDSINEAKGLILDKQEVSQVDDRSNTPTASNFSVQAPNTYTIDASPNPSNSGVVTSDGTYQQGQSCTVSAVANTSNTPTASNFSVQTPNTYTIDASPNPSNGGVVTGGSTYQQGQSCTVSAVANTSYTFLRWTENGNQVSSNANYTFTVTGNRTLVAQFQLQHFIISATLAPSSGGIVAGGGSYNYGKTCTLKARANKGYVFEKWTKNGIQVSTEATYNFTVTESALYVAHFNIAPILEN